MIHVAAQVPSDLDIACDRLVDKDQRAEAWARHEEERWFQACLGGLSVRNIDYLIIRKIRDRLVKVGRIKE